MTGPTTLTRERADLLESLQRHRAFLRFTVRDLSDEQAQRRPTVSALDLAGLVLLGFAAWSYGVAQRGGGRIGRAAALAAVGAALVLLPGLSGTTPAPAAQAAEGTEPFSATRLASLRAEGRPVFVNMTAAW